MSLNLKDLRFVLFGESCVELTVKHVAFSLISYLFQQIHNYFLHQSLMLRIRWIQAAEESQYTCAWQLVVPVIAAK